MCAKTFLPHRLSLITFLFSGIALSACGPSLNPNTFSQASAQGAITSLSSNQTSLQALNLAANVSSIAPGGTAQMYASGGVAPYSFSVVSSSGGTIDGSGVFTAPSSAQTSEIAVSDANGNRALFYMQISGGTTTAALASLALNVTSLTLTQGSTYQFSATGGTAPYSFRIYNGSGTMTSTGLFTAPTTAQLVQVLVSDANGNNATATVNITVATPVTVNICNTPWGCSAAFGLAREIDGGHLAPPSAEADAACKLKGYTKSSNFLVYTHGIGCSSTYGLDAWNGTTFQRHELSLCYAGWVTVMSSIDCQ